MLIDESGCNEPLPDSTTQNIHQVHAGKQVYNDLTSRLSRDKTFLFIFS
ncbi:hypothetical protein [Mucilaginibacter sp. R-33]